MPATFAGHIAKLQNDIIRNTTHTLLPLSMFGGEFTSEKLYCGQQVIGKVLDRATAQVDNSCCGTPDYCGGAAVSGYHDVPFTMSKRIFDSFSITKCMNEKGEFNITMFNQRKIESANAIGRKVLQEILGGIVAASYPDFIDEQVDDVDHDTLVDVANHFNENLILGGPRNMILSTRASGNLSRDPRITSEDFFGQRMDSRMSTSRLRHYRNVETFDNVLEFPELSQNGEKMIGIAFHPDAIRYKLAVSNHHDAFIRQAGFTPTNKVEYMTDPESGLTIKFVMVHKQCTDELFLYSEVLMGVDYGGQFGNTDLSKGIVRITDSTLP